MNLSANEKTTLFLPAGQVLSVVAASGASGSAIRMAKLPGGGDAQSVTAITTGATFKFGPYADTERFNIICTAGSLTVSQAVPVPDTDATMAGNSDHVVPTQKAVKTAIAQGVAGVDTLDELLPATAENDVIVAGPSPFTWVKKTIAQFKTILGLGTAAYTAATAYDAAGAAAGIIASSISDSDTTHCPDGNSVFNALALKAPLASPSFTGATSFAAVGLPNKTPVNATGTTLTLPVADLAILVAGDTIEFEEVTCTKAVEAGAGKFDSAAELATLLNDLDGWTVAENAGVVTAVSDALGTAQNGKIATLTHLGATTSGGSAEAKAGAKLLAAELARLANGDTVTFDGETFTKAAATSVTAGEFADVDGLILCIDGMTNWTAALNGSDIDIEAADVGAASNDKVINLIYYRASAGAVNGTEGITNEICADADFIYHCVGANTVADANWRRIARGDVY